MIYGFFRELASSKEHYAESLIASYIMSSSEIYSSTGMCEYIIYSSSISSVILRL